MERMDSTTVLADAGEIIKKTMASINSWDDGRAMLRVLAESLAEYYCNTTPLPLRNLMADLERRIILKMLKQVNGRQIKAAKLLNLNYTTLNEKVKRYKIKFLISPVFLDTPDHLLFRYPFPHQRNAKRIVCEPK
jgi:DNA-binding NtrC family response regulator